MRLQNKFLKRNVGTFIETFSPTLSINIIYKQNRAEISLSFQHLNCLMMLFLCSSGAMREEGSNMVTYRWDRHGPNMMENLKSLVLSQNNMANVSLMTEAGEVKVDRLVLSASSPYFRSSLVLVLHIFMMLFQKDFLRPDPMAATNDLPQQHVLGHCQAFGGVHVQREYQHA